MAQVKQKSNGHGSLKNIQVLVNNKQNIINKLLKSYFKDLANDNIKWKSPLKKDDFAEYSDNKFLEQVCLDPKKIKLNGFWPTKGPQWDALAKTDNGKVILVEAKANIPELVSSGTGAGYKSKKKIKRALKKTKEYLNVNNDIDWTGKFYQYTNRIAHLYFLREIHKKPAYLVNIYFIGDDTVSGPKTKDEWDGALQVMKIYLGLSHHKLSKYMADVFIEVKDLKDK